jgi:hypothetical protein
MFLAQNETHFETHFFCSCGDQILAEMPIKTDKSSLGEQKQSHSIPVTQTKK